MWTSTIYEILIPSKRKEGETFLSLYLLHRCAVIALYTHNFFSVSIMYNTALIIVYHNRRLQYITILHNVSGY